MKLHHYALAAAFATATSFTAAHAASDSSSSTPTCKSGWVYSSTLKKCVRQSSQIVPDNSLKAQGWTLARAGRYQDAADLFRLVADKRDPEVLNGLGFTHRKMGKVEQGIAFYQKALKINRTTYLPASILAKALSSWANWTLPANNLPKSATDAARHVKNICCWHRPSTPASQSTSRQITTSRYGDHGLARGHGLALAVSA